MRKQRLHDGEESKDAEILVVANHVYCLEWYEDDNVLGMKEDGFSLHLTKEDADVFAAKHRSYHVVPDPEGAYLVSVARKLYREVRASSGGIRRSRPREPDFPRV